MPTILIVDDSAVDRKLVGGLLSKEKDISVVFAATGKAALQELKRGNPDAVVTDLIMSEMDGLELVRKVRADYPLVPIVLMTSQGSEEIAVKALQAGATSYTPKRSLGDCLLETIRHVLEVANHNQSFARLVEHMTERVTAFTIGNDYTLLPVLVSYLQDEVSHAGFCDESERVRVGVALDEALVNALYHGNLELSSDLRDSDHERYTQLVHERLGQTPYRDRRIHVEVRRSHVEVKFKIRDEGPGFDHSKLPDPRVSSNVENLGGRGVLLMRTFMDELGYNEKGNEVTMVKRAPATAYRTNDNGNS